MKRSKAKRMRSTNRYSSTVRMSIGYTYDTTGDCVDKIPSITYTYDDLNAGVSIY